MLTLSMDLPPDITAEEARLLIALKLFETHRVSMGKAAEIAGISKREFMETAGKYGVAIIDYPPGDLEREMRL